MACIDLRRAAEPKFSTLPQPKDNSDKFMIVLGVILAGVLPWVMTFLVGHNPTIFDFVVGEVFGMAYGLAVMFMGINNLAVKWKRYYSLEGVLVLMIPLGDVKE